MIRWIDIRGLRGIRQGRLSDLTPLVVLVGPNGSGKSTVLEALLIAASPEPAEAVGRAVQRHRGVKEGARWLFWKGGEGKSARITVANDTIIERIWDLSIDRSGPSDQTWIKCVLDHRAHVVTLGFAPGNVFSSMPGPYFQQMSPFGEIEDVRLVEVNTSDFQLPLHRLFSRAVEQGRRKQAEEIVAEVVPGLTDFIILTEGDTPILQLAFEDRSVPAALAGDGVQSLLRLTLELAARPNGVVLVEEPELHQHPGAIAQSAKAILAAVRRQVQVVITTHSLELIDSLVSGLTDQELPLLSLYNMHLEQGTLKFFRSDGPEVALARTQIQDDLR